MRLILAVLALMLTGTAVAQDTPLSFDIASLRENNTGTGPGGDPDTSNVPLGPGNVYSPTQGQLNLRNMELKQMISFAYKMTGSQHDEFMTMAPEWARNARYDLRARTDDVNVTKDQLRAMMRSLLADRFAMKVHYEDRETSVYSMRFTKAGTPGPTFRAHTGGGCSKDYKSGEAPLSDTSLTPDGYPVVCGGLLLLGGSASTHFKLGARDMPIAVFATSMTSWGDLGRPVVNESGITGNIDFVLDFVTIQGEASGTVEGDNFRVALRKQLGITLESQKRAVPVLLLDAIAKPTEN